MPASDRRVVITGLGLISPLGNSPTELKDSLDSGRSGIDRMDLVPTDHLPVDFGGECKQFTGKIENFGPLEKKMQRSIKKGLRLMCRKGGRFWWGRRQKWLRFDRPVVLEEPRARFATVGFANPSHRRP